MEKQNVTWLDQEFKNINSYLMLQEEKLDQFNNNIKKNNLKI